MTTHPKGTHQHQEAGDHCEQRDELKSFLESQGVQTLIHYPKALPYEPAYDYLSHSIDDFPVSSQLQHTVLSLPVSPEISEDQIRYVCSMIKEFYEGRN